jgi:hypothetical protein
MVTDEQGPARSPAVTQTVHFPSCLPTILQTRPPFASYHPSPSLAPAQHASPHLSRCLKFDVDLEEAPKSGTYAIIKDLPRQLSEPSGPGPEAGTAYYGSQNSTRPLPAAPGEQQGLLGSSSAMGRTQQGPMLLNSQGSAEIGSYPVHVSLGLPAAQGCAIASGCAVVSATCSCYGAPSSPASVSATETHARGNQSSA